MDNFEFKPDDFEFVGDNQDITKDVVTPAKPFWKDALGRFLKNKGSVIGIIIIAIYIILAIIVPIVSKWDYASIDTSIANIKPNAVHFFGTDNYGRDIFVRLWRGTRVSLFIAVVAVIIDVLVGMTYGMISG